MALAGKRIVLIIAGGIAAYKSLDLIRRLKDEGVLVSCLMTEAAKHFVTPLSVAALSGQPVSDDLFAPSDDNGMAHITLSRRHDLLLVAPATADLLAKMSFGFADDLASTTLLAADKPILAAPAMNARMWAHPATKANIALLRQRGVHLVGPAAGDLACGEIGDGRMAEVPEIVAAAARIFAPLPLAGKHALVTAGPTYEAIDPVRFIGNRSSGKQGYAIAIALQALGARVSLISGPVALPSPSGVTVTRVESAGEMLQACLQALPADLAVCSAAVADWRVETVAASKIKKSADAAPPLLSLAANPDILSTLGHHPRRPRLMVGFAAETENLLANAQQKLKVKGCDLIIANHVGAGSAVFGGDENHVWLVDSFGATEWPALSKTEVADRLAVTLMERLL